MASLKSKELSLRVVATYENSSAFCFASARCQVLPPGVSQNTVITILSPDIPFHCSMEWCDPWFAATHEVPWFQPLTLHLPIPYDKSKCSEAELSFWTQRSQPHHLLFLHLLTLLMGVVFGGTSQGTILTFQHWHSRATVACTASCSREAVKGATSKCLLLVFVTLWWGFHRSVLKSWLGLYP